MPILEVIDVHKRYGPTVALDGVRFEVEAGGPDLIVPASFHRSFQQIVTDGTIHKVTNGKTC
jgi:hypothetical protein